MCSECNQPFEQQHGLQKICSEDCRKAARCRSSKKCRESDVPKALKKEASYRQKRKESGKAHEYRQKRRRSKAGYLDRFLERARGINPDTDLTREYLDNLFTENCSVTGVPFRFGRGDLTSFTNPYAPSIDRINSDLPYQKGNIQIVLSAVNFAKNQMDMEAFVEVWKDIVSHWSQITEN